MSYTSVALVVCVLTATLSGVHGEVPVPYAALVLSSTPEALGFLSMPSEPPASTTQPWCSPLTIAPPHPDDPPRTEPNPASDFTYKIDGNGVAITGYIGPAGDVVIPATINGKIVISIDEEAFRDCAYLLARMTIPNGVTNIGDRAFSDCFYLISVVIPDSVTNIGDGAFSNCQRLTDIILPNGITNIGKRVFANCIGLTDITIPDNVASIGEMAFTYCTGLINMIIPNGVTSIGAAAFSGCGLGTIIIPDSVTSIGPWVFERNFFITVICSPNSCAHQYCLDNNIQFKLTEPAPTISATPAISITVTTTVPTISTLPSLTPVSPSTTTTIVSGGSDKGGFFVGPMLWIKGFVLVGFAMAVAIVWHRRRN